jgi:DNA-binding SARP family transcriptional activator
MGQTPSLFFLGSPAVEWQGAPIRLDRHKALALLAYLSVTGQPHRRDALATLLWPESGQSQARAALRRVLATLTSALPGDWWQTDRETLYLRCAPVAPDGVWLDVGQFQALLSACRGHGHSEADVCATCLPLLAEAAALYRGDFLAGFSLRDSPDFDDWQLMQAEMLHRDLAGALEHLAQGHSARREWETAIRFGRRWLALDPLHEAAHCRLMELYAWAGQPQASLRQYDECLRRLDQELGAPPSESMRALAQALREGRALPEPPTLVLHRPPPSPPGPQPARATAPSTGAVTAAVPAQSALPTALPLLPLSRLVSKRMVGRADELAQAETLWRQAVGGEAQTLVVSGEAGIGKTRLVREVTALAEASNAVILAGDCYAEGGAPYAAISPWLRATLAGPFPVRLDLPGHVLADLLTLAPDLRPAYPDTPPNPPLDPWAEQQRFFDSVVAFCAALAQVTRRPLLARVEDIHWADAGSLALLRHLARRSHGLGLRLLLVMTLRDTEAALAGEQTLQEMLLSLNRERLAEHLHLERLTRDQTHDLLADLLATSGVISSEFLDAIYAETEGNPFFVEEVCKALASAGQLFFAGGRWQRLEMAEIVIPESVREAILGRVARLPVVDQETLRLAAILGRGFDFAVLQAVSNENEETLGAALERAEHAHLIHEESHAGRLHFRFVHALIPLALRQSLSGLRRQRLHAHVAAAIANHRSDDVEALAYHCAAAGQTAQAIAYARQAAKRAQTMYAYESALAQLRLALDLLEDAGDPEIRLGVLEEMADLYVLLAEGVRGVPLYQEALALWRRLPRGDLWQAVRLQRKIGEAVTRMSQFADYQRLATLSRESLLAGLRLVAGQPPHLETVRLLTVLSRDAWYSGVGVDWEAAERYAHAAVEMAEELDAPVELAAALEALAILHGVRGQLRERLAIARRRLELSRDRRFDDPRQRAYILFQVGYALVDIGEYTQAVAHLRAAGELARQIQDLALLSDVWSQLGECTLHLDRWDELLEIEADLRRLQQQRPIERLGVLVCFYLACNASMRARRGDGEGARMRRQEAHDLMVAIAGPQARWGRNQHF